MVYNITTRKGLKVVDTQILPGDAGVMINDNFYTIGDELEYSVKTNVENSFTEKQTFSEILYSDTYWDDLRFPATGLNPPGLISDPTKDDTSPYYGTLLFSPSAVNMITGIAQIPHTWKEGSQISPHIHWMPTSTNTGNVVWQFGYMIANVNGDFSGSYTTDDITEASTGAITRHQISDFAMVDMTGFTVSNIIIWYIQRLGNDAADTYTGNARLLEFDIHYQVDAPGSREEYTK